MGLGRGEYKLFRLPLPEIVRAALQSRSSTQPLADNRQSLERGGGDCRARYPAELCGLAALRTRRARASRRPCCCSTARAIYNRLHRDAYGEHVFPLQAAFLLARSPTTISPVKASSSSEQSSAARASRERRSCRCSDGEGRDLP